MIELSQHFSHDAGDRHSQWLQQQRWFIKAKVNQQRREQLADDLDDELVSLAAGAILATTMQIETFKSKLDAYDEANVIALMENQEKLDVVNAQLQSLLERAYVLEDGRRVFRTEDGARVFDEYGSQISGELLDPDFIRPDQPTWESYAEHKAMQQHLETQRSEIIEFQEKVDSARESVAEGNITAADLEQLDVELGDAMPIAVRVHVPGLDVGEPASKIRSSFADSARLSSPIESSPVATPNMTLGM